MSKQLGPEPDAPHEDVPPSLGFVPVAERIPVPSAPDTQQTAPDDPADSARIRPPFPWHVCFADMPTGCYSLTVVPTTNRFVFYAGTLRVDHDQATAAISGDLYAYLRIPHWPPIGPVAQRREAPGPGPLPHERRRFVTPSNTALDDVIRPILWPPVWPIVFDDIPAYPRSRYHSYLKVTGIQGGPIITTGPCRLALTVEEYLYTQPPVGQFNGSFPTTPSRTFTFDLTAQAGKSYTGHIVENGNPTANVELNWLGSRFRGATLEIHTLQGAVAPQDVPAASGTGTESIDSVFDTAGWDLEVAYDPRTVPVPAGVTPTNCWSDADLFGLLNSVLTSANTDVDSEWRFHLLVVPGQLGCGRGEMFDVSGGGTLPPRIASVSYSNDGYPTSDSSNFGTAANQEQHNVPRAFLRSGCHEVGHGFNQQHQSLVGFGEPGSDNSVMTTTPELADYLAASGTGTFPQAIHLAFNEHCRHHLIHFPDPVVRPGGMIFGVGHSTTVPQEDLDVVAIPPEVLNLELSAQAQAKLGEPVSLRWTVHNASNEEVSLPNDLSLRAQHTTITITGPDGETHIARPVVVRTDHVALRPLAPGEARAAEHNLFWGPGGFAFTRPGRHRIAVAVRWNYRGVLVQVAGSTDLWIDHPITDSDNHVAQLMLHHQVGLIIALRGGDQHLAEGARRISEVAAKHAEHPAAAAITALRPDPKKPAKRASTPRSRRRTR